MSERFCEKLISTRNQAFIATTTSATLLSPRQYDDFFLLDVIICRAKLVSDPLDKLGPRRDNSPPAEDRARRSYSISVKLESLNYMSRLSPRNAEPVWNEAATFICHKFYQNVRIAMHMQRTRGDMVIASASIPLRFFMDEKLQKRSVNLYTAGNKLRASVELVFQLSFSAKKTAFYADLGYPVPNLPMRLRTGDLLFVSSKRVQSLATKVLTRSVWDHIALVVQVDENLMLLEALYPQGVCLNSLPARISSELSSGSTIGIRKLRYDVARCRNTLIPVLRGFLSQVLGSPYELNIRELLRGLMFGGGPKELSSSAPAAPSSPPSENDGASFFCSELIAAAYQAMGFLPASFHTSRCMPSTFASKKMKLQRGADLSLLRDFSWESLGQPNLPALLALSTSAERASSQDGGAAPNFDLTSTLSSSSFFEPPSLISSQLCYLIHLAHRLCAVELRTLDIGTSQIDIKTVPISSLSDDDFNGLILVQPISHEAASLRSFVTTSGAKGFMAQDLSSCICHADPCLCQRLQTSDSSLKEPLPQPQGLFVPAAAEALCADTVLATPRPSLDDYPDSLLSLVRSTGAQGFLNNPSQAPSEPSPITIHDDSLQNILQSSGAIGFMSFSPPIPPPDPPTTPRLMLSSSSSSSLRSPEVTPPSASATPDPSLHHILHSSGARGFLELSDPREVIQSLSSYETSPTPDHPLPVGFIGLMIPGSQADLVPDPMAGSLSKSPVPQPNPVGFLRLLSPDNSDVEFPPDYDDQAPTYLPHDPTIPDIQLEYSTDSESSEHEFFPLTITSDFSEYQAHFQQMGCNPFLDMTSDTTFSSCTLHLEKSSQLRDKNSSLAAGFRALSQPVGFYYQDPLLDEPLYKFKSLHLANASYLLNLLTDPNFPVPGDYVTDPALQTILTFLAIHSFCISTEALAAWLITNAQQAHTLLSIWLSNLAFHTQWNQPATAKVLNEHRFQLLLSDLSPALYNQQQSLLYLADLPAFPSVFSSHTLPSNRLRNVVKIDPPRVACAIASWSFYLYTFATPIHQWFDPDSLTSSASHFATIFAYQAKIRLWCLLSILRPSDANERSAALAFFIHLTNELIRLRDFCTASVLCEAIHSAPIVRLTATFSLLPYDMMQLYKHKLWNWTLYTEQAQSFITQNIHHIPDPTPLFQAIDNISIPPISHHNPELLHILYFNKVQSILVPVLWPLWSHDARHFYLPISKHDSELIHKLARCILIDYPKKKSSPESLLKLSKTREKANVPNTEVVVELQEIPSPATLRVNIVTPKALLRQGAHLPTSVNLPITPHKKFSELRAEIFAFIQKNLPRSVPLSLYNQHELLILEANHQFTPIPLSSSIASYIEKYLNPQIFFQKQTI